MKKQRYGRGHFAPGRSAVLWAIVFAVMGAYPPFAASDVTVGTCAGPSPFTSIQAAVNAASPGTTVRIDDVRLDVEIERRLTHDCLK